MKIVYCENKRLPYLAWIAVVQNGVATVIHGANVETKAQFFVEGAWGGTS